MVLFCQGLQKSWSCLLFYEGISPSFAGHKLMQHVCTDYEKKRLPSNLRTTSFHGLTFRTILITFGTPAETFPPQMLTGSEKQSR